MTWILYLSNMQGKGIFEGLFFSPRFPLIHETGTNSDRYDSDRYDYVLVHVTIYCQFKKKQQYDFSIIVEKTENWIGRTVHRPEMIQWKIFLSGFKVPKIQFKSY